MGTSLWKMWLDIVLPAQPAGGRTEKKHLRGTGGKWATCHCLGNNLTEHLIKGRATKR